MSRGETLRSKLGAPFAFAVRAWTWGDWDRALELGQRALAIATRLSDVAFQASVNYLLSRNAQAAGDYRQGAEILSGMPEILRGDRRDELLVGATVLGSVGWRAQLAWCLAELGEFAEAMAHGEEAVRIAREVDHPTSLIYACRSLGFVSSAGAAILGLFAGEPGQRQPSGPPGTGMVPREAGFLQNRFQHVPATDDIPQPYRGAFAAR